MTAPVVAVMTVATDPITTVLVIVIMAMLLAVGVARLFHI